MYIGETYGGIFAVQILRVILVSDYHLQLCLDLDNSNPIRKSCYVKSTLPIAKNTNTRVAQDKAHR